MLRRLVPLIVALTASLVPSGVLASNCAGISTGRVPLTDLGAGLYQGYQGGLYSGGSNVRPAAHDAAGIAIANAIAPLDTFGVADPTGKVVVISIGMSNATQEFSTFVPIAMNDPLKKANVMTIDCALGGQTAALIKNPTYAYWDTVKTRLRGRRSSPAQVQVAWIKEADAGPTSGFPAATTTLSLEIGSIVRILKSQFPNIGLAYLSSRTYAGYASTTLNPEPYAYESAFAVKWLIEAQVSGVDSLEYDAAHGPVESPWLSWGPYLWADGTTPRGGDGLTWACADFVTSDGTHPAASGRTKVANLLRDFFRTDATTRPWYRDETASVPPLAPAVTGAQLAITPNPAVGEVEISFSMPRGEHWRLSVLDPGGRRVRDLGSGIGDGTTIERRWDARDQAGVHARAGVYWVRLTGPRGSVVRRLALVRGS